MNGGGGQLSRLYQDRANLTIDCIFSSISAKYFKLNRIPSESTLQDIILFYIFVLYYLHETLISMLLYLLNYCAVNILGQFTKEKH